MSGSSSEWLTTDEVAHLLQISVQKLKSDRAKRTGLPFTQLGRSIRYRRTEVERYLELATIRPR
jgi:excisionase family DNA binding protein